MEIKRKVSQGDFVNLIVTALEGGSNYWYLIRGWGSLSCKTAHEPTTTRVGIELYTNPDYKLDVYDLENPDDLLGSVTQGSVLKALQERQKQTSDLLNGEYDAETADILFQQAVMGELVFG